MLILSLTGFLSFDVTEGILMGEEGIGVCLEYVSLGIRYFKLLEMDLSLDASEDIPFFSTSF